MRFRRRGARALTAELVIALAEQVSDVYEPGDPARDQGLRAALAEHGYTQLDLIRAQYWLRRGKPRGYRWDHA